MNPTRKYTKNTLLFLGIAILAAGLSLAACGGGGATRSQSAEPEAPPPAPDRLSASVSDTEVILHWQQSPDADSYTIYRSTEPDAAPGQAHASQSPGKSYTDRDIRQEVSYYYVVKGANNRGESPASPQVAAKARSAVPGAPFEITVVNGDGMVTLLWPEASGAVSFALYFSTEPGFGKGTATRIAPVTSPHTHDAVTNGTTYYYALAGINQGGNESPLSSEVAARPVPSPLKAPAGLSAAAGEGRVTLTWDPVAGAGGYAVYWSLSPGVHTGSATRIAVESSPFEHTGLVNGTEYFYIVTATAAYGESDPGLEVSATPRADEKLPDLVVQELKVLSFSSSSISYQYTIANVGEAGAPLDGPTDSNADNVSVQAVVSVDAIFLNGGDIPAGGTILGRSPLGTLYPGETFTGYFTSTTTVNLATHPYLVLKVDWGAVVVESSEDNNTRAVLIQSQPQAPPAPDGIATQAGDGSVTLLWNSVAGASGYNLYWDTSPGVSRDTGQLIGGVSSPFAHNGLANGVTYYYVVTALAVGLEGGESAEVSATPLAPTQGEGGWNQGLTPMPTGRYAASSATVDGKIYIIGGTSDGYNSLSVVERYDPRTDSWATMAPKPHPNRGGHRAAVVDGMIYVMGGGWGSYTGLMERYDPATDTWQTMPPMPTARSFFAAVAVNGRIYAMGGYNGTYLRTTEIFDPASNTWTTGPILPGSAYGLAACVHQARIYIMGGVSGSNMSSSSLAVLDTTSGQWRTLAPMFESANCMTCQTLNGKIYAFGGWRGGYLENEQDTMVYDPGSNAWSLAAPLPTFRASAESGLVDGVIYVIGGRNKTRYNLDMVEAFTP